MEITSTSYFLFAKSTVFCQRVGFSPSSERLSWCLSRGCFYLQRRNWAGSSWVEAAAISDAQINPEEFISPIFCPCFAFLRNYNSLVPFVYSSGFVELGPNQIWCSLCLKEKKAAAHKTLSWELSLAIRWSRFASDNQDLLKFPEIAKRVTSGSISARSNSRSNWKDLKRYATEKSWLKLGNFTWSCKMQVSVAQLTKDCSCSWRWRRQKHYLQQNTSAMVFVAFANKSKYLSVVLGTKADTALCLLS